MEAKEFYNKTRHVKVNFDRNEASELIHSPEFVVEFAEEYHLAKTMIDDEFVKEHLENIKHLEAKYRELFFQELIDRSKWEQTHLHGKLFSEEQVMEILKKSVTK
jgi:hypothetical protein